MAVAAPIPESERIKTPARVTTPLLLRGRVVPETEEAESVWDMRIEDVGIEETGGFPEFLPSRRDRYGGNWTGGRSIPERFQVAKIFSAFDCFSSGELIFSGLLVVLNHRGSVTLLRCDIMSHAAEVILLFVFSISSFVWLWQGL